jgi:hypothetical protein
MKRIIVNDKTEILTQALEMVDDCDTIVVLYQESNGHQGFIHCGETTQADLNWMIDRFKLWLLGPLRKKED